MINIVPEPEPTTLIINGQQCAYDKVRDIYYFPILASDTNSVDITANFPDNWGKLLYQTKEFESGSSITFEHIKLNQELKIAFTNNNIKLAFLSIPVISVTTRQEINDETPSYSLFSIIEPGNEDVKQNIASTIQIRGGHSKSLAKTSYKIEFFKTTNYIEKENYSLANLRSDDDWILDAMFIDPMRMRNRVSFDVWFKMVNTSDYLYSSKSTNGIHGAYTLLMVNNKCLGLYSLNERFDKKQFNAQQTSNQFGGVLYKGKSWKGTVKFSYYEPFTNDEYSNGWKLIYPNVNDNYLKHWSHLDSLTNFIVNADNETFKTNFHNQMNIRNIIDYYILLNITLAQDNTGKNIFLSKYNEYVPFVISPWDLDGTWGLAWDGRHTATTSILEMNIVDRLLETSTQNFPEQLKTVYSNYRNSFLKTDSIMPLFNSYAKTLQQNHIYELENTIWNLQLNPNEELLFIENWLNNRFAILDEYIYNEI